MPTRSSRAAPWPGSRWTALLRPRLTPRTRIAANPARVANDSGYERSWPSAAWRISSGSPIRRTWPCCRVGGRRWQPTSARRPSGFGPGRGRRDIVRLGSSDPAVLLSALGEPAAETEASRAIALAPQSADAFLVRARVRRRSGDRREALADIESGLTLEPGHPHLLELRGLLEAEMGHPRMALIDLNRALIRGARGAVRISRARTLMALGREEAAIEDWSFALADDPEDPLLYLGRARTLIRLRFWDRALADLEQAADLAVDNARLWTRIACAYATCLPARPDRFPRWLAHARRAWSAWTATAMPHRDR